MGICCSTCSVFLSVYLKMLQTIKCQLESKLMARPPGVSQPRVGVPGNPSPKEYRGDVAPEPSAGPHSSHQNVLLTSEPARGGLPRDAVGDEVPGGMGDVPEVAGRSGRRVSNQEDSRGGVDVAFPPRAPVGPGVPGVPAQAAHVIVWRGPMPGTLRPEDPLRRHPRLLQAALHLLRPRLPDHTPLAVPEPLDQHAARRRGPGAWACSRACPCA